MFLLEDWLGGMEMHGASLLTANTLGLNDYQYGKIKEEGLLMTFAKGMLPITVTKTITAKTIGVIDGKRPPQALLTEDSDCKRRITARRKHC